MKTTRFYVIVVEHIKSQTAKVSQEAYDHDGKPG